MKLLLRTSNNAGGKWIVCIKLIPSETIKFYCGALKDPRYHRLGGRVRIRNMLKTIREGEISNIFFSFMCLS